MPQEEILVNMDHGRNIAPCKEQFLMCHNKNGLVGLHFLAFWPCRPSHCILALWAFISFHFGLSGVSFWAPPTSCQKLPVCPTSLQWIYQRRDRLHFAVFSLLGLHFFAFWPCGPSFPCILAFWAFISLHFGLVRLHFLSFWHFWGSASGAPPSVLTVDLSAPWPAPFCSF